MEVEFYGDATQVDEFCDYNSAQSGSCGIDNPLLGGDYTDFYCEIL